MDFQEPLANFEKLFAYPLGQDFFHIDHGADYFAFFKRLGQLHYFIALDQEIIVGVMAAILRNIPLTKGAKPELAWYLCDLKIHPDYQGKGIHRILFQRIFDRCSSKCKRSYGISMNLSGGKYNRLESFLRKMPLGSFHKVQDIGVFSVEYEDLQQIIPLLTNNKQDVGFLNLKDKKDLILVSSGLALPILHIQQGVCSESNTTFPQPGFVYMFCLPTSDPHYHRLISSVTATVSMATVFACDMEECDWHFLLTSDI